MKGYQASQSARHTHYLSGLEKQFTNLVLETLHIDIVQETWRLFAITKKFKIKFTYVKDSLNISNLDSSEARFMVYMLLSNTQ
jgi:hypothetical protein